MEINLSDQLKSALAGDYEILRELGGGGMSRVFGERETRLEREVEFAARLQHPHIVPLLSAGSKGGVLYYTMPYVHGPSLAARIKELEPLRLADAVAIFRDVADALAFAHSQGVVPV